jgi:hypothetical protein
MFPDISVSTKHEYEIEYKYIYTCTNPACGIDFRRQRKLDLVRMGCGKCKSRLIQTKPNPNVATTVKQHNLNPFSLFLKENFPGVKREYPRCPHKEIMGTLSRRYRLQNGKNVGEEKMCGEDIAVNDVEEVKEVLAFLDVLKIQ